MGADGRSLPDDLVAWIGEVADATVVRADRQPGGARKEAWFVDVAGADGTERPLFLRYDRSDPAVTRDPWTLHREARFYVALQDTAVPVPTVLGVHPVHQAMLSERVVGGTWFSLIADTAEQEATARDFISHLAALHRIDPRTLDLPGVEVPSSVAEAVLLELDEWDRVIEERGGEPDPALAFTLGWLRRNVPDHDGPVVLVQGDTGPGNFLYRDGRVVAIVDWELAHFGDPMDDIAWLSLRATQEPFTDFPARLREYEQLSGHGIDEGRVRYFQVMAEAKLQVMVHPGGPFGGDIGNGLIYGTLHRRLWLEALAAATGLEGEPAEVPPPAAPGDHAWLYDALLAGLRDVVPRIDDPLAQRQTKGFARAVKYLQRIDAHGAFYDACELDDLAELLGDRPASLAAGREAVAAAVRTGKVDDAGYLRYLWRRIARETELARPAMGALADRHWPPLRNVGGLPPA